MADSFLSEELLTETNHEILRHLESCPSCRSEIDDRRRLRGALRAAFDRAPDLQPTADFGSRLRGHLLQAASDRHRSWRISRRWLALAAGIVLVAGLSGALLLSRWTRPAEALVRDAVGDHQNCALNFRLVKMPVPLEEAAQQFDSAYGLLINTPPNDIRTPDGPARVIERHSCAYGARRFGHVIMEYRGRVVSLLMTASDAAAADDVTEAVPHVIGRQMNGLSVVSVSGLHHAVLLVSDLDRAELTRLSQIVSVPLAQRLQGSLLPDGGALATLFMSPTGRTSTFDMPAR